MFVELCNLLGLSLTAYVSCWKFEDSDMFCLEHTEQELYIAYVEEVAGEGGYILDASAIMQNDTSVENLRAMTEAAREYGVYSAAASASPLDSPLKNPCDGANVSCLKGMEGWPPSAVPPGTCFPWETKLQELPEISGDTELLRRIWQNIDSLGNTYIWQCLLSF